MQAVYSKINLWALHAIECNDRYVGHQVSPGLYIVVSRNLTKNVSAISIDFYLAGGIVQRVLFMRCKFLLISQKGPVL